MSPVDDVKQHVSKAWVVLLKFRSIWQAPVSLEIKRSLFTACVSPVFMYGLHAYENSKYLQSRISGAYTRMLRYALNAKFCGATKEWTLHTEQLLGPTLPITTQLVRRRLSLVGHSMRMHLERQRHPFCDILMWEPKFPRKSGGQCHTLRKTLFQEVHVKTSEELFNLAANRKHWTSVCATAEAGATASFNERLKSVRNKAGRTLASAIMTD